MTVTPMEVDLTRLPARSKEGAIHVVVETPRGSQAKIKYEPELKAFKFSRPLIKGLVYPYDWGFIPGTIAPDGDPLDAMIFSDLALFPGIIVECRPLAIIKLEQNRKGTKKRERNDRLIVVPVRLPRFDCFREPADLPVRWRNELEDFFITVTRYENKDAKILGWAGSAAGERMVTKCVPAK